MYCSTCGGTIRGRSPRCSGSRTRRYSSSCLHLAASNKVSQLCKVNRVCFSCGALNAMAQAKFPRHNAIPRTRPKKLHGLFLHHVKRCLPCCERWAGGTQTARNATTNATTKRKCNSTFQRVSCRCRRHLQKFEKGAPFRELCTPRWCAVSPTRAEKLASPELLP